MTTTGPRNKRYLRAFVIQPGLSKGMEVNALEWAHWESNPEPTD